MLQTLILAASFLAAEPAALPPPPAPDASAQRRYEEERIQLDDFAWVTGSHHEVTTSIRTIPFQGKYRRPLEGAEFYRAVGRPDLEATYRERDGTRTLLLVAGIGGVVAGALYTAANFNQPSPSVSLPPSQFQQQMDASAQASRDAMTTGLVISGVGLLVALVGGTMDPNPVDALGARRLADEHNRRLRQELGLPEARVDAPPEPPRLSLGILPGAGGASALLRVSF
jgi:hypothetical protein